MNFYLACGNGAEFSMRLDELAFPISRVTPPISKDLLTFEIEIFAAFQLAEIAGGCRCCCWAASEDDPVNAILCYNDEARIIAPLAFCQTCASAIEASEVERIVRGLRPMDFVRADAIDAWGGALLGDPSASLKAKAKAVSVMLRRRGERTKTQVANHYASRHWN